MTHQEATAVSLGQKKKVAWGRVEGEGVRGGLEGKRASRERGLVDCGCAGERGSKRLEPRERFFFKSVD